MSKPKLSAAERLIAKQKPQDRAMRAIKEIMPPGTWVCLVTVVPGTDLSLLADAPNAPTVHNMLVAAIEMVAPDAARAIDEQQALKSAGAVP